MTTIPHDEPATVRRPSWLDARDMWTSLAITSIWLTVFATALFGPDIHSIDAGGSSTTIPSGVVIALFALFATMSIAKHGFTEKRDDG
jgi:hypothetical protein